MPRKYEVIIGFTDTKIGLVDGDAVFHVEADSETEAEEKALDAFVHDHPADDQSVLSCKVL